MRRLLVGPCLFALILPLGGSAGRADGLKGERRLTLEGWSKDQLRVLLDPTQPQNADTMAVLKPAGATVRFYLQAGDELLHAKAGIIDGSTVLFGSCNWSRSGFTRNHELDLLIQDTTLARVFLSRMAHDWSESTP